MGQYEKIIEQFVIDMAMVSAPMSDYVEALRDAIGEIQIAIEAAKEMPGDDE